MRNIEKRTNESKLTVALNIAPDAGPKMILRNAREAVDGFVREAEPFDDLTMLCVEYKGKDV